eukprot:scaffold71056_cov60-Phaeocystis_antarctica.AAC.1
MCVRLFYQKSIYTIYPARRAAPSAVAVLLDLVFGADAWLGVGFRGLGWRRTVLEEGLGLGLGLGWRRTVLEEEVHDSLALVALELEHL